MANELTKETTEIVFILDRSGSMYTIADDAIGGFNSFLAEQKAVEGDTKMTLILFDTNVEVLHDGVDINKVEELNSNTYKTDGMTALLDAIGTGIDGLNKRVSEMSPDEQPTKFIFAIMTDGAENMSRSYTSEKIKNKIQNMTGQRDYQFIFLGANIDAVETASSFGIDKAMAGQFTASGDGGSIAMLHASEMILSYRNTGVMDSYVDVSGDIKINTIPKDFATGGFVDSINLDLGKSTTDVPNNKLDYDTGGLVYDTLDSNLIINLDLATSIANSGFKTKDSAERIAEALKSVGDFENKEGK